MKRRIGMFTAFVLLAALFAVCVSPQSAEAAPQRVFLSIAGGPAAGSTLQDCIVATAGLLNQVFPDRINVTPEASPGGSENVTRVNAGEADMASAFAADLWEAYTGTGFFEGRQQPNIRGIGMFLRSVTHFVALQGSGIRTVNDFVGRRVAIGGQGTGTAVLNERLFRRLGIWDQIHVQYLGAADQVAAMRDGQIDVMIWSMGVPGANVVDLSTTRDIVLIDLDTPARESGFYDAFPAYMGTVIPANTYRGVDYDVPTIQSTVHWIVHKDVDAALVYNIMGAVYSDEGLAYLRNAFGALRDMNADDGTEGLRIPLHAGAERFWAGRGVEIREDIRAR